MRPCARSCWDAFVFVLWFDPSFNVIDAELFRDSARRAFVVAGEHDNFDSKLMKMLDYGRRGFLDRIGDGDDARRATVMATKITVDPCA